MSFSLRRVSSKLEYPRHKWFTYQYHKHSGHPTCPRKQRMGKKRGKYEWFNENMFDNAQVQYYDDNVYTKKYYPNKEEYPDNFFISKSGMDKRWRLVYRIRMHNLNSRELYDIYMLSRMDYVEKHGMKRYI
ncbi:hypothetical protein [Liquorilactobacillus hordei]|uniref:hypothetical protein n=1 Tax=Liquorilactobacillus hordei TaxID=468911 RepID=UPI0039E7BBE4